MPSRLNLRATFAYGACTAGALLVAAIIAVGFCSAGSAMLAEAAFQQARPLPAAADKVNALATPELTAGNLLRTRGD